MRPWGAPEVPLRAQQPDQARRQPAPTAKNNRTALGSRCCGRCRQHLSRRPSAPDRAQNAATERRPSPSREQRRTAPRDRTWEQRDRNRLPWPVTSRHIQSAGVAGNDCLTSPCRSISHRSAPFSLLFRSTATALLGASRRVGEVTLGQRLGEMQVGRALTKADGTLTKGR